MDIFLPLEVVSREYTGRLFLAVASAAKGHYSYFGHKPEITKLALRTTPKGVWYGRGSVNKDMLAHGLKCVGQDEEAGLISDSYSDFFKLRPGLVEINSIDRFFCWGRDDYVFLKSKFQECTPHGRLKLVLSGSPRTITWGNIGKQYYKEDIASIHGKYGNYVLLASNFAHANSFMGEDILGHLQSMESWNDLSEIVYAAFKKERRLMKLYVSAAKEISLKSGLNVVIRPHPTEDSDKWSELVRDLDGVFVETKGDVSPWILGSQAIIHNCSTTGIEAACSDIPTIALGESEEDLHDGPLTFSNKVSLQAYGVGSLLETLREKDKLWDEKADFRQDALSRKVVGYDDSSTLDTIIEQIASIDDIKLQPLQKLKLNADRVKKRFFAKLSLRELYNKQRVANLGRGKRPPLNQSKVENDIKKIVNILNIKLNIECCKVGENSYLIRKAEY